MARGIKFERDCDDYGNGVLTIHKSRGKLSVQEIGDLLRYEGQGQYHGVYAIIINARESTCGGSGWFDEKEPKGDCVALYELYAGNDCPVCSKMLPDPDYCPHCGEALKGQQGGAL